MAIINKTKILIVALVAIISGGGALVWNYFLGGKARPLAKGQFVVAPKETAKAEEKIQKEYLAIIKSEDPAAGVRQAVAATGNLDFIAPGQTILIKPNMNTGLPYPASTNPEVLREVIRLVKARGAGRIILADRSYQGVSLTPLSIKNMKESGIYKVAEEEGAEIIGLEEGEWERVRPEGATHWRNGFRVPKILFSVDHIISLPVLKTHSIADYTMALKNSVGLVSPKDMAELHTAGKDKFMAMLAEINLAFRPSLFIMDGTRAFISGGPNQGEAVDSRVYLASADPVAIDIAGLNILKQYGAKLRENNPWNQGQIRRALELNLNAKKQEEIESLVQAKLKSI